MLDAINSGTILEDAKAAESISPSYPRDAVDDAKDEASDHGHDHRSGNGRNCQFGQEPHHRDEWHVDVDGVGVLLSVLMMFSQAIG